MIGIFAKIKELMAQPDDKLQQVEHSHRLG
jgi:hypothetical protein